ncbi:MAG: insulinase family protein [Chloroflexi bacterium]|nr:insulinase family protein [Chloroflexota bacterium]
MAAQLSSSSILSAIPGPDDIIRRELPNGITVLVRENFTAQSVVITGSLVAGAVFESPEKQGLVGFATSSLMRGTKNRDFTRIHEELEGVGANLRIGGGMHEVSFGGKSLGEDLPLLLDILSDALRNPSFPESQVERLRGEIMTGLKIRLQNTRYMASRQFARMIYPPEHPYHRFADGEFERIKNMTIDDLRGFQERQFGPQGMMVVVVGNVKADDAVAQVGHYLGDWVNPDQQPHPELPPVESPVEVSYANVVIPGKSQSDIVLGVPGPSRYADDFQAARMANNVLGVFGMMGRLGKNVREEKGLAYYSYSQLEGGPGPGAWRVIAGVDPSSVKLAVEGIKVELDRMLNEPVSEDDLDDNKMNLIGSLPLQLESNEGVAGSIYNMEYYGLGLDYLRRYANMINSLQSSQLQEAMRRYWSTDAFALAVAGPELEGPVL